MARYTAAMINIRLLIEQRIKAKAKVTVCKEVAGASDLASLLSGRLADGGCYVIPESDQASKNTRVNAVSQRNQEQFAVIYSVRNVRDQRGADAADACHALRAEVLAALLGWVPNSDCEAMEKVNGRLVSFVNGFYVWKDVFQTAQYIHS